MAFGYYKTITINHGKVTADQTNFPVLVDVTDATYLRTVGNGGHVQNSNGYDIYFYSDSNLTTRLPAEREYYDGSGGRYIGWVTPTNIYTGSDTVIYMAYGDSGISTDPNTDANSYNAAHVWDTNFKAVYHYGNGSSLNTSDSTGVYNESSHSGVSAVAGEVDGGMNVGNKSGYVNYGNAGVLAGATKATFSLWFYLNTFDLGSFIIAKSNTSSAIDYQLLLNAFVSGDLTFNPGDGTSNFGYYYTDSIITTGAWIKIDITYDSTDNSTPVQYYKNGSAVNTNIFTNTHPTLGNSSQNLTIGAGYYANTGINGYIDEVRLSNSMRSANWLATEYNNQNSPGSFITSGADTVVGGGGGTVFFAEVVLSSRFGRGSSRGIGRGI